MRKYVAAGLALAAAVLLATAHAEAQTAFVASPCGNQAFTVGTQPPLVQTPTGTLCTNESGGTAPAPLPVTPTDRGGTITLGGTAQTLAASNTSRKGLVVQNPCSAAGQGGIGAAEDLYISVTGNATVNGGANFADLAPCGSANIAYNGTVITAAVTVNAATTGHRWSSTETQ